MVRRSKPSRIPPPRVLRSRSSSNLLESDADVPADSSGGYDSGYTGSSSSGSGENVQQWRRHRLSTGHGTYSLDIHQLQTSSGDFLIGSHIVLSTPE